VQGREIGLGDLADPLERHAQLPGERAGRPPQPGGNHRAPAAQQRGGTAGAPDARLQVVLEARAGDRLAHRRRQRLAPR
jgi:hypothetical protein